MGSDKKQLDKLKSSFMYSMLFKEILFEIEKDDGKSVQDLIVYCRSNGTPESQLKQFQDEHRKKAAICCKYAENFNVYRGQGFGKTEFRHLLDAEGGLLAFNNFLSTSKEKYVATDFVDGKMAKNPDTVGVIFIMTINPTQSSTSTTPFVMVDEHSDFSSEHEILFAMHTIFRVGEIKQTANNSRLWEVQLTITDDSDPQLAALTDCFKEEIGGEG
ncbi:unnamed protein product [Rotaria magnacalcarata]|uniref:Uncharacterized protein n=1 Tax=Rotaria magnacalcarata TaxID=392030 RepID=A0A816ZR19_9BILA|nr:unnamed protein product [Rotaria magnacalcarata]